MGPAEGFEVVVGEHPPGGRHDDDGVGPVQCVEAVRGVDAEPGRAADRAGAGGAEPELVPVRCQVAPVDGEDTFDPSFGMPAKWVAERSRVDAEANGYVVVEPSTVLATHLMETLKGNAAELLGRQDVQEMVDLLKESYPALVEEVVGEAWSVSLVVDRGATEVNHPTLVIS